MGFLKTLWNYYAISIAFIVFATFCYLHIEYTMDQWEILFYVFLAYPIISILKYAFGYLLPDNTFKRILFYIFR